MLAFAVLLTGCFNNSKIPEDALLYNVTAVGVAPDDCHNDADHGFEDSFEYAVAFTASSADIYVDGEPFATGTISGCTLDYQTVVLLTERPEGNLHWRIAGRALLDPGDDACVEGELDFDGTETIEIVESDDDNIEPGCEYHTTVQGTYTGAAE